MTSQMLSATPRPLSEFDGYNGRFDGGDDRKVHLVAPQPWIGHLQVAGPACRTPNGSFHPDTFNPVTATVSCKRCKNLPAARAAAAPGHDASQLRLALEDDAAQHTITLDLDQEQ